VLPRDEAVLIVNADDFGLSPSVNRGVIEAFERRLVSSATVMPNMPAFEEACALVRERGLEQHVGTHLVLTAGSPLTARIRNCERFCEDDGTFRGHRERGRLLRLDRDERAALYAELREQVDACRRNGVPVTHLDSHQHVHTEPGVASVVATVARDLGIRRVRLTRNCRPDVPVSTRIYRAAFNGWLRRKGLAATRYFGDIDDYAVMHGKRDDLELMAHPDLDDDARLVDFHCAQPGTPLEELLSPVERLEHAESYTGARL
jgi:predicted glycoside hydrolase/deacetylase ChbG (UPF0249 family)